MATKKAASTKKATARKPAAAKTTVRTVSAEAKKPVIKEKVVVEPATVATSATAKEPMLPGNIVNIVLAELFGTFILTLVALATFTENGALYAGLALTLLVLTIGVVSGAHVNPAVTFGLWAARKLKAALIPFYWGGQFLGAILAVIASNWISGNNIQLDFSQFTSLNWTVFGVEMVGAAVFLFGLVAVVSRRDLSNLGRALGVGTSLMIALVVGGTLLSAAKTTAIATYQRDAQAMSGSSSNENKTPEIPHVAYVKSVSLNPAVSLAATDSTKNELTTGSKADKETTYSRLSLEVVLGTLVGAAVGGNLYLLIAGRKQN